MLDERTDGRLDGKVLLALDMYPIKMGEFRRQVVLMLRQRAVFSDKTTAEWKVGLATRL